jgi:hypothetical protein
MQPELFSETPCPHMQEVADAPRVNVAAVESSHAGAIAGGCVAAAVVLAAILAAVLCMWHRRRASHAQHSQKQGTASQGVPQNTVASTSPDKTKARAAAGSSVRAPDMAQDHAAERAASAAPTASSSRAPDELQPPKQEQGTKNEAYRPYSMVGRANIPIADIGERPSSLVDSLRRRGMIDVEDDDQGGSGAPVAVAAEPAESMEHVEAQ